jgi:undecaprenyl-diphosphatase
MISMIVFPEWLQVSILAVVQGIAEFLPVSSSGHLNVFQTLMGKVPETAELNVVLHFGTLLAIVTFYWKRILALLTSDRRVIPMLIVGTIPAAVIGIVVKKNFEHFLSSPMLAGLMFPITGAMLIWLSRMPKGETEYVQLTYKQVIIIGFAQAFALLPGISRSGTTIVMGSLLGLKRQAAATYSFLLAIPAILGASLLEAKDIYDAGTTETSPEWLIVGAVIAFVVGLVSLRWLVSWLEEGKLHLFAYYLIPLGIIVVAWLMLSPAAATPEVITP